jgi:hypothetical protein
MNKRDNMTEEMKEKIAVDAFNILMNSELDTNPLHDYARKANVPVSYVLFIFNKWIHRTDAPCPSKDQLDEYNKMVFKRDSNKKEKRAKLMFDKYLESGFSKETMKEICSEYNLSEPSVRNWITKYVNGEFHDIGLVPTTEEVLKYNELYALETMEEIKVRETKKALIAKDCFDAYLASNFDKKVLDSLCTKYNVAEQTVLSWIRNYSKQTYLEYGFSPSLEEKSKYETLMEQKNQEYFDARNEKFKSNRAPMALDAFNIYLSSGLSLDVIPMLAAKHNVTENVIKTEIRKYRNGEYADFGYAPSEEEKQKYETFYSNRIPRRKTAPVNNGLEVAAEGYAILLANNLDRNALNPLASKLGIRTSTLSQKINNYRKRVVDPKPTLEQEFKYVAMSRKLDVTVIETLLNSDGEKFIKLIEKEGKNNLLTYLDKLEQAQNALIAPEIVKLKAKIKSLDPIKVSDDAEVKTYNLNAQKCVAAMMEYIEGNYYSPLSIFKKYVKDTHSLQSYIKYMMVRDEKVAAVYPLYEKVKKDKINKFQELLVKINQNMLDKNEKHQKYNIIDLCLDIDTNVDDFATMMRYLRATGVDVFSPILNALEIMIKKSGITTLKSTPSIEQVSKLKYNYNGIELTDELKQDIINFLSNHKIRIMTYTIILTFEKYVRGEIEITPEFHI